MDKQASRAAAIEAEFMRLRSEAAERGMRGGVGKITNALKFSSGLFGTLRFRKPTVAETTAKRDNELQSIVADRAVAEKATAEVSQKLGELMSLSGDLAEAMKRSENGPASFVEVDRRLEARRALALEKENAALAARHLAAGRQVKRLESKLWQSRETL